MVDFPGRREIVAGVKTVLGPSGQELGEMVADRVRFGRWQRLVKIMERAAQIKNRQNRQQIDVPLKFFLPFVEEAGKESDDNLIDLGTNLLASANESTTGFDLLCIDLLKKLSHEEAKLLTRMYRARRSVPRASGDVSQELEEIAREIVSDDNRASMQILEEKLLQVEIIPINLSKMFRTSGWSIECRFYRENIRTILALEHLGMLQIDKVETRGNTHLEMMYMVLSDLAYEVVRRCSGRET